MSNTEDAPFALALTNITKRFGTTLALDDVSFALRQGTVHALLGENGAGKTTLMRVAFGLVQPDRGSEEIFGIRRNVASPIDAIEAGMGMVHQHFTNVPPMTVAENVALGNRGRYDPRGAARRVLDIARTTGLALDPTARVEALSVGAQQRLEIVKALARDARILILDEPTAVLAPAEADELMAWLRRFSDAGNSVVLITHKLREALAVASDVTVLRHGQRVFAGAAAGLRETDLAAILLGESTIPDESTGSFTSATAPPRGEIVAGLRRVSVNDERGVPVVRDATFEIAAGEVVGIAAVEGSGQRTLLRVLAGRSPVTSGDATLPSDVGFVPEDRHRDALVLDYSATENVMLRGAGARSGLIRTAAARDETRAIVEAFDVRGVTGDRAVRTLSGGNQQKLVLGRELEGSPPLVVAENPTRGLDIRATRAVHDRLRDAAAQGAAVVVYSSDVDEVLALATRLLVMHAGSVREVPRDREAVGRAMLGVS